MAHRVEIKKVAPDAMKAFGPLYQYVGACGLDRALVDTIYMRVSQINGCAYCVDLHWRDAMKAGDDARKFNSIVTWRETSFFSERERAALNWAESLTNVSTTHAPDEDYDLLKAHFSDKEIADITVVISLMNAMNRIGIGQRLAPPAKIAE